MTRICESKSSCSNTQQPGYMKPMQFGNDNFTISLFSHHILASPMICDNLIAILIAFEWSYLKVMTIVQSLSLFHPVEVYTVCTLVNPVEVYVHWFTLVSGELCTLAPFPALLTHCRCHQYDQWFTLVADEVPRCVFNVYAFAKSQFIAPPGLDMASLLK